MAARSFGHGPKRVAITLSGISDRGSFSRWIPRYDSAGSVELLAARLRLFARNATGDIAPEKSPRSVKALIETATS